MRNGHSGYDDPFVDAQYRRPLGFTVLPIGREWVVTSSRLAEVRVGDLVAAVNGESVERFFQRAAPYIAASNARWARRRLFRDFESFAPHTVITLQGGRTIAVDFTATLPANARPADLPRVEGRVLVPGQVAYIRVPAFTRPEFEDSAIAYVRRFRELPAVVIDVRGNGGGDTPSRLTRALMNRPYRGWTESTPMTPAVYGTTLTRSEWRWSDKRHDPDSAAYSGRVVLLTDGGCFSACEDFVAPFKDNRRAALVGDTTAGSTGQPVSYTFPNGITVWVSAKREQFPDGAQFEGRGIVPDRVVVPTVADVARSKDPVLERALAIASRPTS